MNLFIMNYDDIVRLYKPQNKNEDYIISIMKDMPPVSIKDYEDLKHENAEYEVDIRDNEDEIDDLKRDVDRLENIISKLESDIEILEDTVRVLEEDNDDD